jgi:hypothetical protein
VRGAMSQKDSLESFLVKLKDKFNLQYKLINKKYLGSNIKHKFKHECGEIFEMQPKKIMMGTGKCSCLFEKRILPKQTQESYCSKLKVRNPNYILKGKYKGYDAYTNFKHLICGNIFKARPIAILTGLKKCSCLHERMGPDTLQPEIYANRFKKQYGNEFKLISDYIDNKSNIKIQCKNCGRKFKRRVGTIKAEGNGRLTCSCKFEKTGPKNRTDKEWQKVIDKLKGKGEYKLIGKKDYYNRTVQHKCGLELEIDLRSFVRSDNKGKRCECELKKRNRLTTELHNQDLEEIFGKNQFKCLKYNREKSIYKHIICGYVWKTSYPQFCIERKCPACWENDRISNKIIAFQKQIDKIYEKGEYRILNVVNKGKNGKINYSSTFIKHNCGYEYEITTRQILKRAGRCPKCYKQSGYAIKYIKIKSKVYKCVGYEPKSLEILRRRYPNAEIITSLSENKKQLGYTFEGKRRMYTPDFYIPDENFILEVKSPASLGLYQKTYTFFNSSFEEMQAKAKKCIKLGYEYEVHVYKNITQTEPYILPQGWEKISKRKIAKFLKVSI